jgi:hypothetical protein
VAIPPTGEGTPTDDDGSQQMAGFEARLERLEQALEGLQDALYRHQVLQDHQRRVR